MDALKDQGMIMTLGLEVYQYGGVLGYRYKVRLDQRCLGFLLKLSYCA